MYSFGHFKKIGLISIILLGIILFFIDPEYSACIPKCPFRWFTGLDCPACGSQRAIHQLLHLNIKGAFGYNPFLILSLPYLMALVITQWFDPRNRLARLKRICHHPIAVNTYLILIIVWWIARNILPFLRGSLPPTI